MKTKIYSAMKKIFLLTIVFFKMSFVFGQTSADWSPWITADCYKGIKYKVANWGKVSGDYSDYYWGIMFQNTYSQPISFSYHFSVGNENPPTKYNYTVTYQIEPGGVYSNDGTKATAILFKSSSTNYKVSITDVCVGNCDSNYINCQGVPQNSVTNSSNSNSNSTNQNNAGENFSNVNDEIRDLQRRQSIACGKMQQQGQPFNNRLCTEGLNGALPQNDSDIRKYLVQLRSQVKELESMNNSNTTTQQNDLTDYNNSKADLERELAEHNAGIERENQRIAQENARRAEEERQRKIQQQQQYVNSLNQAQQSIANKDYTGAIQSYGEAGKNATTNGEKNVALGGVLASGAIGIFSEISKAKEAKLERQRLENEKKERKIQELETDWTNAKLLADGGDYDQAIKLMLSYAYSGKLNGMALNSIGSWYWKLNDYASALTWYKISAEKQDANAFFNLGVMYENGSGVEKNLTTALQWYNDACKSGNSQGCENHVRLTPIADAELKQKMSKIKDADVAIGNIEPFFKNGMFGFKNATTKEIKISAKYNEVGIFSNGLALAKLEDKFGYIDKLGNIAIPFIYTKAFDFTDGVAVVATNTQKGASGTVYTVDYEMIDVTGKTIAKYFLMYNFKEGLARARLDDKDKWGIIHKRWGFIDKNGKIAIPFNFDGADDFNEGLAKVEIYNGKNFKHGFIDKTGTLIIPALYDFMTLDFSDGMAKVEINDKYGFIDKTGKLVVPIKYTNKYPEGFTEGLAAVEKGKKYGFIDKNGLEVIPLKYQDAGEFSEGLAVVKLKDKFGFIDKNGTEAIPLIYDGCRSSFKDGLAIVKLNGKWGCIDKTGKVVISIQYESLTKFQNGFATIELNGKIGRIDREGNEYW